VVKNSDIFELRLVGC